MYVLIKNGRDNKKKIPGSTMGIFPEGEDSRGDHGLGRLEEFRFKVPITKREGIHWNAPQLDTVIA